jgi:ribose transport system permease protein
MSSTDLDTRRSFDWRIAIETFGPVLALVVLVIVTTIIEHATRENPVFMSVENWLNILKQNAFVGIVAIGMTIVIIGGGIDLSVGSLVAMAGGIGVWLMNAAIGASKFVAENDAAIKQHAEDAAMGLNLPLDLPHPAVQVWFSHLFQRLGMADSEACGVAIALIAAMLIATLAGWIGGFIIAKGRIAPFIATLGLLAFYRSAVLTLANGGEIRSASMKLFPAIGTRAVIPSDTPGTLQLITWPIVVFFLVAIIAAYVLNKTRFGRYVFAIGSNERAAVYSAIHVDRIKIWTYALMGLCCGIAAVLLSSRLNSVASSSVGSLYELDAIAAVVIGGTRLNGGAGRISGTIVGILILGVINNMLGILDVSPYVQGMVKGGIILAAALLQQVGRKN